MNEQDEKNAVELYRRYRPEKLSEVLGQPEAIETLKAMGKSGKVPGFLLLTGPSGCGKTTLARILKEKLKVGRMSFREINAAQDRGIDLVRRIEKTLAYPPMDGEYAMWLIDEAHQLTADAQGGFLKLLEDVPDYVKYVFCTTDPQKLRPTIKTRATTIVLKAVPNGELEKLVTSVAEKEGVEVDEEVVDKIVDISDGSPRKALVSLGQVINVPKNKMLDTLNRSDPNKDAIEIARALLDGKSNWATLAKILKGIEGLNEQAETIRWMVLSFMTSVAIKSPTKASVACDVISRFQDPFYDSKAAGLVMACFDCVSSQDD